MSNVEVHEQSVEQVLGRVSDAFFALDADWQFTFVNEQAERLLERPGEKLVGESIWHHFPEAEGTAFHEEYHDAMETQESRSFEEFYPPLDSWFRVHAYPSESGLSVYFEDVTDRRRRTRELVRYQSVVETMGDGVYVVDDAGRFTMVNEAYAQMVGYPREELVGSPVTDVVDDELYREARELERELETSDVGTVTKEATIERPDGETVVAEATFSLMTTDDTQERVAVVRDATERKRRQERLEEHRDMLAAHVDRTELVQRINQAIVGARSQAVIRDTVCEVLTDSRFYQVAWIGARGDDGIQLLSGAGTSEEGIEALVDAAHEEGEIGPIERALRRRATQVQQHIEDDPTDPRAEVFSERGYHSSISLPLEHDGEILGVLTIDSERTHAFTGTEREMLADLADTVAYAMQTVEDRKRYRSVVDDVLDTAVDAGIVVYDDENRVRWLNERTEAFFGRSRDEVRGLHADVFIGEHLNPAFEADVGETSTRDWLAETGDRPVEYHLVGDDGESDRYVERRCTAIDAGLYAGGRVALYYDITGRKESERRLAESERRRRTLLQNLPGMAYRCRVAPDWTMEFVSDGAADLTGYEPAQIEDGEVSWEEDLVHPDDQEDVRRHVRSAIEAGEPFEKTYRITTADGEVRWVWEQGQEVTTLDGEVRIEGFMTDVTERRRRRQELRRQHELNQQLFETSPVAILAFDSEGTLSHANTRAIEGLGIGGDAADSLTQSTEYSIGDLAVYDEDGECIPPDERPVYRTLELGETITDETILTRTEDGEKRWFTFQSAPVFDEDGEVELAVVACDDITATKERQAELSRLDHINSVIRRLNTTLVESTDQETVRETVCAELAAAEPYSAAWYCDVDLATDELVPLTTAGLDDVPADATIAVDDTPSGDAITTGEVTVGSLPADHPYADAVPASGLDDGDPVLAAVPITHSNTQYGVLCLTATDESAFTEDIRDVFAELGRTIGHALTSIVRREGLLSDSATRLEFRLRDYLTRNYDFGEDMDGADVTFEFDDTISLGDGMVLQYVTVTGAGEDGTFGELLAASDDVEQYRRLDTPADEDAVRYEVRQPEPPLVDALTEFGGRVLSVEIADGDFHVIAELPTSASVRDVVQRVTEIHPSADLEAQRSVDSSGRTPARHQQHILGALTDRQRTSLETAYFAGYFDWPRATTGEEVAEALDLSPSTFSQHLRAGERKTFAALFDGA